MELSLFIAAAIAIILAVILVKRGNVIKTLNSDLRVLYGEKDHLKRSYESLRESNIKLERKVRELEEELDRSESHKRMTVTDIEQDRKKLKALENEALEQAKALDNSAKVIKAKEERIEVLEELVNLKDAAIDSNSSAISAASKELTNKSKIIKNLEDNLEDFKAKLSDLKKEHQEVIASSNNMISVLEGKNNELLLKLDAKEKQATKTTKSKRK